MSVSARVHMSARLTAGRWRTTALFLAMTLLAAVLVAPARAEEEVPGTAPGDGFQAQAMSASAGEGLQVIVHERGKVSQSIDAAGSTSGTAQLRLHKPAGATLRRAVLLAASTGFAGPMIGSVDLDGMAIDFDNSTPSDISSVNYWEDVTDRVRHKVDTASAGQVTFTVTEDNPLSVDGVILALIFDDPNQTADRSATLLFGGSKADGDAFTLHMTEPLDPSAADSILEMSLGISYGYQQFGGPQYSVANVNGRRLTTSAGGEDDGEPRNGALITVGGTGDQATNPSPSALPSSPRTDDELYDLRPFVEAGDTTIRVDMRNPSRDDNIFFAAFTTNPPVDAFLANQDVLVRVRHGRTERFFDDAYRPSRREDVEVVVAPHIEVDSVELRADGLRVGELPAGPSYLFSWLAGPAVTSRSLEARVTDTDGNVHTETLRVYALVSSEGVAVSYLPDNPDEVEDPNLVQWNAFSADPQTPQAAPATVAGYEGKYRSHNGLSVFAKSDGSRLVGQHTDTDRHVGVTYYCDAPPVLATTLDSSSRIVSNDGTRLTVDSRLESRVNTSAPNVWAVLAPPGLVGPLGHSRSVPSIFSTVRSEVRADGTSSVVLPPDRDTANSWYPMHHAYDGGSRIGGPAERPQPDQVKWARTVDDTISQLIAQIPVWAFDAPTFFMQALRAECARQRLERVNPEAYEALHSTWNTLLGMDNHRRRTLDPILLALKAEVWMHMFPVEWREGRAGPDFVRSPDCMVPGCPGVAKWRWVTFRSPVTVHVYDDEGRHNGYNPDGTYSQELEDVLHLEDAGMNILRVPDRPDYRIEVKGTGDGVLTVDTGHYDGPTRNLFEQYYKLPVVEGSHGIIDLGQWDEGLRYDAEGDGSYAHLMPETRTIDPAPQDSDAQAPTTSVRVNGAALADVTYAAPATVTLSAADDLAGVDVTDYSFDGGDTWQRYRGPIILDADGQHAITVRSEDYNGNVEAPTTVVVRVGQPTAPAVTFDRPVEASPALTTVQHGRVLPVKAAFDDPTGPDAVVAVDLRRLASCPGGEIADPVESTAPGSANTGNLMRFDAHSGRWIYNLSTGNLQEGTCYRVEVRHGGNIDPATGRASGGTVAGDFVLYVRS